MEKLASGFKFFTTGFEHINLLEQNSIKKVDCQTALMILHLLFTYYWVFGGLLGNLL